MGDAPTKARLRRHLGERRAALRPEHVAEVSARICTLVLATPEFDQALHVVIYAARRDEIDPGPIAAGAVARGVPTYYPRVEGRELAFCAAMRESLGPGPHGIPEPGVGSSVLSAATPGVLILVPGLAFDWSGVG